MWNQAALLKWLTHARALLSKPVSMEPGNGSACSNTETSGTQSRGIQELVAQQSAVLQQLSEGVIITDRDGRITFVNGAAERLHGLALLGVRPEEYTAAYRLLTEDGRPYPPGDLPLAQAVQKGVSTNGARWRIERPDGSQILAIGSACPVRDSDGNLVAAVLTVRDDTDRFAAEHRLRESESQLRMLADGLPMLVAYVGPDMRYRVANRAYSDWFGLRPADVVGRTVQEVIGDAAFRRVVSHFEEALAGHHNKLEAWMPYETGARFVRAEYIPHRNTSGGIEGLFVVVADDTERKKGLDRERYLMREVEHRAKNALAAVQAIIRLSRADTVEAVLEKIEGRVAALGRSHMILAESQWSGTSLRDLVVASLHPYLDGEEARLILLGQNLSLSADMTQPLSLVLHELATNAAKYGALSVLDGTVAVSWREQSDKSIWFEWCERGGPPIVQRPERQGFGTELLKQAVLGQLNGTIDLRWDLEGLRCNLTIMQEQEDLV